MLENQDVKTPLLNKQVIKLNLYKLLLAHCDGKLFLFDITFQDEIYTVTLLAPSNITQTIVHDCLQ